MCISELWVDWLSGTSYRDLLELGTSRCRPPCIVVPGLGEKVSLACNLFKWVVVHDIKHHGLALQVNAAHAVGTISSSGVTDGPPWIVLARHKRVMHPFPNGRYNFASRYLFFEPFGFQRQWFAVIEWRRVFIASGRRIEQSRLLGSDMLGLDSVAVQNFAVVWYAFTGVLLPIVSIYISDFVTTNENFWQVSEMRDTYIGACRRNNRRQ